ncbi:MAG TPA: DinB family protein [Patescibacteria group bacterium]|jgi:uncharacterized damage-inducible protein DinB|nr:DinB family protein [Patescibacteria group bacterium]
MITKDDILSMYRREIDLTVKVLRAVPEGQLDYKPHEKSNSVKDILRTFIAEMHMNQDFLRGQEPKDTMKKVPEFDFITEGIATFENSGKEFLNAAEQTPEEDYNQPLTMWGMNQTRGGFVYMLLLDLIHHRGQLSVYVRLAGGLVPSIYGPSADDNGGMA